VYRLCIANELAERTFRSCWRAASSRGTPLVHALMGTPVSGFNTL
jgi:hypothetical protein